MSRKVVTEEELIKIINSELSKHEECNDCRVKGIMASAEDETGCNWSAPILSCSGTPADICIPTANNVFYNVRKEYNFK